jgi:hypothetical protein
MPGRASLTASEIIMLRAAVCSKQLNRIDGTNSRPLVLTKVEHHPVANTKRRN